MACRLIGAKPLSEPVVEYLLIGTLGTNVSEILIEKFTCFHSRNAFENVVSKMAAILSRPQCVKRLYVFHQTLPTYGEYIS